MKRFYVCIMVTLLCYLPLSGITQAQELQFQKAEVSGRVWLDDGDGIQQPGETAGVQNVTVKVYKVSLGASADFVDSAITKNDGTYSIKNLPAGLIFYVQFLLPENYVFAPWEQGGSNALDSDANPADSGKTLVFTPVIKNSLVFDAGMKLKEPSLGTVSGHVWDDKDYDGIREAGESGLVGLDVILQIPGIQDLKTQTGVGGLYIFENVPAGTNYKIKFQLEKDYQFSPKDAGDETIDSDAGPADGATAEFTLVANSTILIDAGMFALPLGPNPQINGILFHDTDKDGVRKGINTDPGLGGWTVQLLNSTSMEPVATTTTNNNQAYGTIGRFEFNKVPEGTYYVKFVNPGGYLFTAMDAANNDNIDSDVNPFTGKSNLIKIEKNTNEEHVDAGVYPEEVVPLTTGSIGDFVWYDTDGNGIQDHQEPGVPNVRVMLFSYDNQQSAFISETKTDAHGKYIFSDLNPGNYRVRFILPDAFDAFTLMDAGSNDALDSDALSYGWTATITLNEKEDDLTIDAGLIKEIIKNAAIGDFVWKDRDMDGIQDDNEPGVPNVTVELYKWGSDDALLSDITNSMGKYSFENLEPGSYYVKFLLPEGFTFSKIDRGSDDALDSDVNPQTGKTGVITLHGVNNFTIDAGMYGSDCMPASLGDLVWNDCNKNGILDPGEPGMEGVVVKLHACTGDHSKPDSPCGHGNEIASAKTDKDGKYYFYNIMPGYYFVEIVVPCHYTVTKPDQGKDDWKDSDINPATRYSSCINLAPGQVNLTMDAGLYPTPPATLGDFVWIDANKNGIQDNGEKGLCGVTIELYMCGVGSPVASAKTDNDGKYIFKNVIPNTSYSLKFYLPKGFAFSSLDQGSNDNFDSDVCAKSCGGMTRFYDVLPDEVNMSIDCGMYLATTTACNYVWKDNNNNGVKDENEAGIQGVTVELYNCSSSTLVKTAQTDAAGLFTFTDILLDTYFMKILIPDGYKIGKTSPEESGEGLDAGLNTNGQSSCFDITEGATSIGKPVALVLSTTGVVRGSEIPTEFSLQQNYPNPFNPSTTIEFAVPAAGQYVIKVFNMLGQEVATLIDRELPVGYHMVVFDASRMPSGMYLYRLSGNNVVMIKKMMLSK